MHLLGKVLSNTAGTWVRDLLHFVRAKLGDVLCNLVDIMGGLGMGGFINGLMVFLASSLCIRYEAKYLKMNKGDCSENSPRYIFVSQKFTL